VIKFFLEEVFVSYLSFNGGFMGNSVRKKCKQCGFKKKVSKDKDACSRCGGELADCDREPLKKSEMAKSHR